MAGKEVDTVFQDHQNKQMKAYNEFNNRHLDMMRKKREADEAKYLMKIEQEKARNQLEREQRLARIRKDPIKKTNFMDIN